MTDIHAHHHDDAGNGDTDTHDHPHHHHGDCCRNPIHCFIPPDILDQMAESDDPETRRDARDTIGQSEALRETRNMMAVMAFTGMLATAASPTGGKYRRVHDMKNSANRFGLPGTLVRSEGDGPTGIDAVDEAYDNAGHTYDFYDQVLGRNSIDGNAMTLVSSVHFGRKFNNAFWNGTQMTYGDGDGRIFVRFTKSLEVVGHELTHGVVQFTSNLVYQNQPGALNEHFADVFGVLIEQWFKKETADQADWLVGDEIMAPASGAKALRTFKAEKAFENSPVLGTDQQPKHMSDIFTGTSDNGGVHINSGIPNHAFYLVATQLGGYAWEKAGQVWYRTLQKLNRNSEFEECAETTYDVARRMYAKEPDVAKAVQDGWAGVGIKVS